MEHILVIIIVGLAIAGFLRKILTIYRDGDCGCGCNGCSHVDGCSDISRRSVENIKTGVYMEAGRKKTNPT
jgi:hypothetical protein